MLGLGLDVCAGARRWGELTGRDRAVQGLVGPGKESGIIWRSVRNHGRLQVGRLCDVVYILKIMLADSWRGTGGARLEPAGWLVWSELLEESPGQKRGRQVASGD